MCLRHFGEKSKYSSVEFQLKNSILSYKTRKKLLGQLVYSEPIKHVLSPYYGLVEGLLQASFEFRGFDIQGLNNRGL